MEKCSTSRWIEWDSLTWGKTVLVRSKTKQVGVANGWRVRKILLIRTAILFLGDALARWFCVGDVLPGLL